MTTETLLEMARRHVAEGEERCAKQELLIARIAEGGYRTAEAERLLMHMQQSLDLMRDHLWRLEQDEV